MADANPAARAKDRERHRLRVEQRLALGLCSQCGRNPAAPNRRRCEPCLEKRRASDRAKYAADKAAGKPYGGRDPNKKRKTARAASKRRKDSRREANLCTRCGQRPPVEGGVTCEPCRVSRREANKEIYAARRSARLCVRCGAPATDGGSRCAPCSVLEAEYVDQIRKNESSRKRYWSRRSADRCTDCGEPSQGASRCPECAKRSYERSDHFRGWPVYPPNFTVVLLETDEPVATFDDEMEVAAYLAFEKLDRDKVEVIVDRCPIQSMAAWE